jgi:hypothetical protein
MATSIERRVSGVSERRRYRRGSGRRLGDRVDQTDPQARVNDVASELAKTAGFVSHSSLEWADCITQEVDAVLSALKRLRP